MNSEKLHQILQQTTRVYRKGQAIEERRIGNVQVTEIFGYPHTSEAPQNNKYEKVDMVFIDVLIDREKAKEKRRELEETLAQYPQPERLAEGPSYMELSPNCGLEQEGGLRLMALGDVLGLWKVISGKTMGMPEGQARELAGRGFLMISGYNPRGKK